MPASRFHDGKHGATYFVRVFAFGRELRVTGEDNATLAVWKTDRTRAAPEADPDGAVTLTNQDQPGVLLVDDNAELDTIRHAGIALPGVRGSTRGRWIAALAGLLAVLVICVLTVNALPRWLAAVIPRAWEHAAGEQANRLIVAHRGRCTGAEGQAALDRLVGRLRAAGGIETPVTLSVLDDATINAFTLPGGHVLVMRGLIGGVTDGPMLAGVIAHELGHVAHRDPTILMIRGMEFSLLLNLFGFGDTGSAAASGASSLMNLAFSRAAEAAADASAIDFLTKAGLRADGLSRFFALMEQRETVSAGMALSWFATHPPSQSRRERTARTDAGNMPFTEAEWSAIRTMCATGRTGRIFPIAPAVAPGPLWRWPVPWRGPPGRQ